jgi:hypothetical protein
MPIRSPRWFVQSPPHRLLRTLALRLTWPSFIDVFVYALATVVTYLLTVSTVTGPLRVVGWVGFAALVAALVGRAIAQLVLIGGKEGLRRRVIWECLALMHKHVFNDSNAFRLTFFIRDPVVSVRAKQKDRTFVWDDVLVPFVRRQSGHGFANFRSRTYFPCTSNSITAKAWANSTTAQKKAPDALWREAFTWQLKTKRFTYRQELTDYYERKLDIDSYVASRISTYMIGVVQILSFPLVDNTGAPMGLLSVDSTEFFGPPPNGVADPGNEPIVINSDELNAYLEGTRRILIALGYAANGE